MRYAILDVGTNSVKLLVADYRDQEIEPLLELGEITRLGQNVSRTGRLMPEAIERTAQVVDRFLQQARRFEPGIFLAYGTSALRDASNRDLFLQRFRDVAGFDCQVVSGEEEAELIFLGATSLATMRGREAIVFDIGGGSVEFIRGKAKEIQFQISVDCGAVRMTEMFLKSDPPAKAELAALVTHVLDRLRSDASTLHAPPSTLLVGTGGTIHCLASMELKLERPEANRLEGHRFTRLSLAGFRDWLSVMPLSQRKQIRGLPSGRADIIVAGAWILVAGLTALGREEITVSARNLRYGAIRKHGAAGA